MKRFVVGVLLRYLFQPSQVRVLFLRSPDEVCRSSGLPAATVSSTLAMMELKGLVKQVGGMNYSLAREIREKYQVKVE